MKILLDDDITMFSADGTVFPKSVRSFSIEPPDFSVHGISETGEYFAVIANGKIIAGNATLKKRGDAFLFSATKSVPDDVVFSQKVNAFGGELTLSVLQNRGAFFAVVENADSFITAPCAKSATFLHCDKGVVVKSDGELFIVTLDGDFSISQPIPYTTASLSGNVLSICYEAPTMEGIVVKSSYTLLSKSYKCEERHISFLRRGNYSEKTIPVAFLERLLFASDEDVFELLCDDFTLKDVDTLRQFVGFGDIEYFDGKRVFLSSGKGFSIERLNGKVSNVFESI